MGLERMKSLKEGQGRVDILAGSRIQKSKCSMKCKLLLHPRA